MKKQFVTMCCVAVLVIVTGCSQPVSQRDNEPLLNSADTNMSVVESGNEPATIKPGDAANVSQPVDEGRAQASMPDQYGMQEQSIQGSAVMLDKAAEMEYRMMPYVPSPAYSSAGMYPVYPQVLPENRDNYTHFDDNPVKRASEQPVSTFSIDVDTGSYALVRRMLNNGQLPVQDAVRSEELINYFPYDYPVKSERSAPFALYREIAPAPWNRDTYLLHIGIKGFEQDRTDMPAANLVFLIDVSGSMQDANKLELVKSSLKC